MSTSKGGGAEYRRAMRERGYRDGRAGRPAGLTNAHYQQAWRRGREAQAAAHLEALEHAPPAPGFEGVSLLGRQLRLP